MVYRRKPEQFVDNDDEETNFFTVKTQLKDILWPTHRNEIIEAIKKNSIISTKISSLASIYFLHKVQNAIDSENHEYFEQNDEKEIRQCFMTVLAQNFHKLESPFREYMIEYGVVPPRNVHFGNAIIDLAATYTTNLKNNLFTHRKKRLREFLKVIVYENNHADPVDVHLHEQDINNAISFAIFGLESIKDTDVDCEAKRFRRDMLLDVIDRTNPLSNNIENTNISKYTKIHWFKSIAFWIKVQRKLDAFNTSQEYRDFRQWEREHFRVCHRQPSNHCSCKATERGPPKINNLAVIPICKFTRAHYPMDSTTFWDLLRGLGYEEPNSKGKFTKDKEPCWAKYVDLNKIKKFVRGKKDFHYRLLSNGQSVSILYHKKQKKSKSDDKKNQQECNANHKAAIVDDYNRGNIKIESGSDPGVNTWQAVVVRSVETGKEVNYAISSKHYHWLTKQKERNRKAKRWTKDFVDAEQRDRNNRGLYPVMPSPKGDLWLFYIRHRLKMLERGLATYTSDKYTRLSFDKYVQSNKVCDSLAGIFTNHQPALVHIGAAQMAPDSPIGIKKGLRCPGNRKMKRSYKKCKHCHINMVDEYFTSQTCAKCFRRFDRRTRRNRFKTCLDCRPYKILNDMLPSLIVTEFSRREMREQRLIQFLKEKDAEEAMDVDGNERNVDAAQPNQLNADSLLPTIGLYHKTWLVNPADVNIDLEDVNDDQFRELKVNEMPSYKQLMRMDEDEIDRHHKTVWQRDIVAAKCILIKGHCEIFGLDLPVTLRRPRAAVNNHNN